MNLSADPLSSGQPASARKISKASVLIAALAIAATYGLILYMVRQFMALGFGEDWYVFSQTGWRLVRGQTLYFFGLSLCVARLKPLPATLLVVAWWAIYLYTPWFP